MDIAEPTAALGKSNNETVIQTYDYSNGYLLLEKFMTFSKIRDEISKLNFSGRSVLFLLLFITIIAFGLLIPFLGYYFDDWPVIWLIKTDANFWDFYLYDRPFSAWTYVVTTPVLGTTPWHWHLFTLILRWLTTCFFWWVLKSIWPNQLKLVTWSALLFAVYPAFFQQSVAVAYSQHFTTYIFFLLSLSLMVSALRKPRFRWGWIVLSVICQAIHLFTMEYFWGLELIRPVVIWIVLSENISQRKHRFISTLKNWLPYFAVLLTAIYWRVLIYQPPIEDPNALAWLDLLVQNPFAAFVRLIEIVFRDIVSVMLVTWNQVIRTDTITFNTFFSIGVWIIVILSVLGVFVFIKFFKADETNNKNSSQWRRVFMFLGLWSILCGFVPIWLTNRESGVGMYADRFALAGIFGASILMIGIIDYLLADAFKKRLVISLLVGLAIGLQIRVSNNYRWDWIQQQRFYWQFHWRVPALEPNTAIFAEGSLFGFMGDYPTSFALNVLQIEKYFSKEPAYWFFELDDKFMNFTKKYLAGNELNDSLRNISFEGWSLDSIILDYNSQSGSCLWVVDEGDELVLSLPDLTRIAIPMSDVERIITDEIALTYSIPEEIFGQEPPPTWCYYFQKAALARQKEDWDEILNIKADVDRGGYEPQNPFEWIPFVDAYLQFGLWQDARELTLLAYADDSNTAAAFCQMWERALAAFPDTISEKNLDIVYDQLACYQYQP